MSHLGERLSAYIDGELEARERSAVEAHVADCADCASEMEHLLAVDHAARALPLDAPPGYFDAFPGRVRNRVAGLRPPRRLPVWTWAAAAALLVAVLTPLTLRERHAPAQAHRHSDLQVRASPAPLPAASAMPAPALSARAERPARPAPPTTGFAPPATTLAPPAFEGAERARSADAAAARDAVAAGRTAGRLEQREEGYRESDAAGARRPADEQRSAAAANEARPKPDADAARQREQDKRTDAAAAEPAPAAPPAPAAQAAPRRAGVAMEAAKAKKEQEPKSPREYKAAASPAPRASAELLDVQDPAARLQALLQQRPVRADQARALAQEWRDFAQTHPQHPQADEARVRTVEALASAWRLGGQASDREQARAAAQAYLRREDARQKPRVQRLEAELSR